MTLATADQCSEAEARDLTDRLRAACVETNRLASKLPRSARRSLPSSVYFIQTGFYDDDPVKIGIADSVQARLVQLQTASPYRLRLLGVMPGGATEERALHQRFAHLRLHGEWFEGADELLTAIAEMTQ